MSLGEIDAEAIWSHLCQLKMQENVGGGDPVGVPMRYLRAILAEAERAASEKAYHEGFIEGTKPRGKISYVNPYDRKEGENG